MPLKFSVRGLPAGTGLNIDLTAGAVYGVPTQADAQASPLQLIITGLDEHGREATARLSASIRGSYHGQSSNLGLTQRLGDAGGINYNVREQVWLEGPHITASARLCFFLYTVL